MSVARVIVVYERQQARCNQALTSHLWQFGKRADAIFIAVSFYLCHQLQVVDKYQRVQRAKTLPLFLATQADAHQLFVLERQHRIGRYLT
ncbi:hypothetical protein D3C71_1581570 [compost metagenome]